MIEQNLKRGDTGDSVKILQEKLKILGFYNPIVNGSFGLATEEGVKSFQQEFGLEVTGVVDNGTWEAILGITEISYLGDSNYPILGLGSSGEDVADLQKKLKALLYYAAPITSSFDLETQNAVKRFQYNNDLTTTGIVNDQTWIFINDLYGNISECAGGSDNNINIPSTTTYTVQRGDTLYSIAKKFNTSVDSIKSLNNLTSNTLSIGQTLKIPSSNGSPTIPNTTTYTVQRGDTLYSIAKKFNTSVDSIKSLNNLSSNTLSIGQTLKIPSNSTPPSSTTYTVQRGDTLYSIAKKFNTSVDSIKSLNNLSSNTLSIGQTLKIPSNSTPPSSTTYTVQRGDTLYSIAKKFNTSVDSIKSLNNLSSNTLSIGQVLKINS